MMTSKERKQQPIITLIMVTARRDTLRRLIGYFPLGRCCQFDVKGLIVYCSSLQMN